MPVVITLYCRRGGKVAVHAWKPETSNIGEVSYLVMQVYEPLLHTKFRAVHHRVAALQTVTFSHLPSDHFLRTLPGSKTLSADGRFLDLSQASV